MKNYKHAIVAGFHSAEGFPAMFDRLKWTLILTAAMCMWAAVIYAVHYAIT